MASVFEDAATDFIVLLTLCSMDLSCGTSAIKRYVLGIIDGASCPPDATGT
jgi:hypothetical protein